MDYSSNSKKMKAEKDNEAKSVPAEKNLEKVIIGDATIQKKGIGGKAKDLIADVDLKGAMNRGIHHVIFDVLIPSARRTAYDMWIDFGKQTLFRGHGVGPESRGILDPRGLIQRITYNTPVQRSGISMRDPRDARSATPISAASEKVERSDMDGVLVGSKEEAELVLEKMTDVAEAYDVVSMHDLKELLGHPRSHVDHKWGWVSVADATIHQVPQGWLIEFSPPLPVHNV